MLQGTRSSKRKKQAKLQRVVATVKKAERKGKESHTESFAALHLLHDPQEFAEKLFSRLQVGLGGEEGKGGGGRKTGRMGRYGRGGMDLVEDGGGDGNGVMGWES